MNMVVENDFGTENSYASKLTLWGYCLSQVCIWSPSTQNTYKVT